MAGRGFDNTSWGFAGGFAPAAFSCAPNTARQNTTSVVFFVFCAAAFSVLIWLRQPAILALGLGLAGLVRGLRLGVLPREG